MIGISVAARKEWDVVLNRFKIKIEDCNAFPFGEYVHFNLFGEDVVLYRCGVRKMNCSASTQYMIDHFDLKKVIVAGTCAGIDNNYNSCEQCEYYYKNQSKISVLKNSEIELVKDAFDFYCSCHEVFSSYDEGVELRIKVDEILNKLKGGI